jgi:hypothetical protein
MSTYLYWRGNFFPNDLLLTRQFFANDYNVHKINFLPMIFIDTNLLPMIFTDAAIFSPIIILSTICGVVNLQEQNTYDKSIFQVSSNQFINIYI